MPFCCLIRLSQASCDLFFLDLKRGAREVFVLHLREVRDCCLSDLFVFDLIEAWSEIIVPP